MRDAAKPDTELDDLGRRLRRGVLIRRLVIGIGAIAVGIALLVLSVVTVVQSFRLLRTATAMALFGAIGLIAGFVTLRVGEIRDDLSVHDADPVPWKTIALAAGAVALAIMLVAAWPLGIYRRVASLASPCRKVVTSEQIVALGGAPFEIADVEDTSTSCVLIAVAPRTDRRILSVRIDGPGSGYRREDRMRSFSGTREHRIGERAWLLERSGERIVVVQRTDSVAYVHLAAASYDDAVARRLAERVVETR